jgi:hypothetical protein
MEFTGTIEPDGTRFDSWADEGQVAYYANESGRIAEEVVAWGTTSEGSRVPLSWNVYGSEDASKYSQRNVENSGSLGSATSTSTARTA